MSQPYAQLAREHWARHRPHQLALIPDERTFFTDLGQQIWERVDLLSQALEGLDIPGEGYLGKVGRLRMARFEAQAQVLRELLPEAEQDEQDANPSDLTPTASWATTTAPMVDPQTFWPSLTTPPLEGWMPVEMSPEHPRYHELDADPGLRRV